MAQGCHQSTSRLLGKCGLKAVLSPALPVNPLSLHTRLWATLNETDSRPQEEASWTEMPTCLRQRTGPMYHPGCAEHCVVRLLRKQGSVSAVSGGSDSQGWKADWACLPVSYSPGHRLYPDNAEAQWKGKDLLGYRPLFTLDNSVKSSFVPCSCCL